MERISNLVLIILNISTFQELKTRKLPRLNFDKMEI